MQYYALSGLGEFDSCTRGDALRACPWLSYPAPLALDLPVRPTSEAKSTTISDRFAHGCPFCFFASSRRADLKERLYLQRFSLPSHQLHSGRHRHSRLPEDHGKQSWSRGVVRNPVATAMVISRRRRSWSNLLPQLRRTPLLLLVYRRLDRYRLQVTLERRASAV